MSLVSIIVPVYNTDKYLRRCVDSLISQTYANIEILLIDDGSTDLSPGICDEYAKADERVRAYHIRNGGVSSARNFGLEKMVGEYVVFVDSDDWIVCNAVEQMLALLNSKAVDLCLFSIIFEHADHSEKAELHEGCFTPLEYFLNRKGEIGYICSPCNKIYVSDIISKNNLRFTEGIKYGEDFIFNTSYLKHISKLAVSNEAYYHYDTSREDSGAKKLHEEYGNYIIAMQASFSELLRDIEFEQADELILQFIAPRWDYAINVCLDSDVKLIEKARIITKWLLMIPTAELNFYSAHRGELGIFCRELYGRISEARVLSIVKRRIRERKMSKIIVKVKRFLRRK